MLEELHLQHGICRHKKETHRAKLDVVAVISNPVQFDTRYRLFHKFCKYIEKESDVRLLTVELQQRNRPFVTNSQVKLRSDDEIWYKENLLNIGIQHLPKDWEYVAWIDADIEFINESWVRDTIEQLQTYDIVQLFTHAIDLGPKGQVMIVHTGFCYLYVNKEPMNNYVCGTTYKNGHTGYAFACKRSAYDSMGGLLDFCILGSADAHMCLAWIGEVKKSLHSKLNDNYKKMCLAYQDRCERHIKRNIGFVHGSIIHRWHSDKPSRQYSSRWKILLDNDFDPLFDIKKNSKGLYILEGNKAKLRDEIRMYFRQRQEDSIDMKTDYALIKKDWI